MEDKENKRKDKVAKAIQDKKIIDNTSFTVFNMIEDLNERLDNEIPKIADVISRVRGEKGDSPTEEELIKLIEPRIPPAIIPENGKDYVLTDKDKSDIAKSIKVPIVEKEIETIIEKTETIHETPIVTENIVEKAMYEEPDQIVKKINTSTQQIDNSRIKGFADLERIFKLNTFNPTMGPSFSDLSNLSKRITTLETNGSSGITLTTVGASGIATLISGILNIPNYTYTLPTASTSILGGVKVDGTSITISGGVISATTGGSGTVTSVASADGSITITNPTTTVDLAVAKAPILTTARTIGIITGDATSAGSTFNGSANNTNALTLATVNTNTGSWGTATQSPQFTVNGKGLITAAANVTITPAVGSITGLGTGVATALGVNVGSAGAFITFNGNAGTPSALVGTNITGTASGLTAGNVTTNANLTGVITSVGNATSIASQTGTGTKFVVDTSPTIVTLNITTSEIITNNGLGATTAIGSQLINSTAAVLGTQQVSPATQWTGRGWGTTAGSSQSVDFRAYVTPVQSTIPTGTWALQSSIAGGSFADALTVQAVSGNTGHAIFTPSGLQMLSNGGGQGGLSLNGTSPVAGMIYHNWQTTSFIATTNNTGAAITFGTNTINTSSTATVQGVNINYDFRPTTGSATYAALNVTSFISQTGSANGITRGIYVNPSVAAAADFRGVEINGQSATGTPIVITSGTLNTTTKSGAIENDGTHLYYTPVGGSTRYQLDQQSAASGITIGTSAITSGTTTRILYDNAGVVGEYTLTGTGTVVAMQTSPNLLVSANITATTDGVVPLVLQTTSTTATVGPSLDFYFNKVTQANNDLIGAIVFNANDSTNTNIIYSDIEVTATNVTHATRASQMNFNVFTAGSSVTVLSLLGHGIGVNKTATSGIGVDVLNTSGGQGLRIADAASSDISFSTFVTGDAQIRFNFAGSGLMSWGSGAAVADTDLYRSGVGVLKTDTAFIAATGLGVGAANSATAYVNIGAGTTTIAPQLMVSGTLNTTAQAGAKEFDGKAFYATSVASSRQVIDTEQYVSLSSNYTLTSQTAAQKLFNSSTNGALTVASSTSYYFECVFAATSLSSSSGSFGFAFGGTATLTSQGWEAIAIKGTALTGSASGPAISWNTAANTALTAVNLNPFAQCHVSGMVRINAGGTLIPQISLGIAAAAIVQANSFFRIWPVGTDTVTNVGNWS